MGAMLTSGLFEFNMTIVGNIIKQRALVTRYIQKNFHHDSCISFKLPNIERSTCSPRALRELSS